MNIRKDFAQGRPQKSYLSYIRMLNGIPPYGRDLIKRHLYLMFYSIVALL